MLSVLVALVALVATSLQTKTSGKEVGRANRAAVDWWNAEDELVGEQRWWWRRWATRRQLRSWRDQETADGLRHVQTVLVSWMLLLLVAMAGLAKAASDWLSTGP
jgi:hypothetical protein